MHGRASGHVWPLSLQHDGAPPQWGHALFGLTSLGFSGHNGVTLQFLLIRLKVNMKLAMPKDEC